MVKKLAVVLSGIFLLLSIQLVAQTNKWKVYKDSTKMAVIGTNFYRAHQGLNIKTDSSFNSIRYTKLGVITILFKQSTTSVLRESIDELEDLLALLKRNPAMRFAISGHADNLGKKRSNLIISKARARVIKNFFIRNRIAANRLEVIFFGDAKPICETNCKKNRRVEIQVLSRTEDPEIPN